MSEFFDEAQAPITTFSKGGGVETASRESRQLLVAL